MVTRARFHPFLSLPILYAQWHFLRRSPRRYVTLWAEVLRGTWGSANFFFGALGIFPKAVRFAYEMANAGVTHVHAHFANHPALAGFIIHRLTGIPFSFTAHAHDLYVERRMLAAKVEAAAFVVTISSYNKQLMVETCGEEAGAKIHVIHCGVDPTVFSPGATERGAGPFTILCVGALEEKKGHRYLIDACQLLQERGVRFVCHLVGAGPYRRQLETRIAQAGLQDQVHLHGGCPRPEVVRLLSAADVFALASVATRRGKREGIPVVLMEAMASGLPVVASALSGIPELVESGRTGLLVPPRDATALADALHTLHNDARLRQRMGQAGRETVLREFDLSTNAAALATLFLTSRRQEETPRGEGHPPPRCERERLNPETQSRRGELVC
jgi:colanic acid/amylovoran biosynthesis glycosyltransferase